MIKKVALLKSGEIYQDGNLLCYQFGLQYETHIVKEGTQLRQPKLFFSISFLILHVFNDLNLNGLYFCEPLPRLPRLRRAGKGSSLPLFLFEG
jgi:hypothetical protein